MYGPTVVITTLVDSASLRIDDASPVSAVISGSCADAGLVSARRRRTPSSFSRLRPASAQRVVAGAWRARYSAVSAPVNPVAPNTTMSYSRSAIGLHLAGERHCLL